MRIQETYLHYPRCAGLRRHRPPIEELYGSARPMKCLSRRRMDVADQVTPDQLNLGMLFPPQSNILGVEIQTAERATEVVFDSGLVRVERPPNMEKSIRQQV